MAFGEPCPPRRLFIPQDTRARNRPTEATEIYIRTQEPNGSAPIHRRTCTTTHQPRCLSMLAAHSHARGGAILDADGFVPGNLVEGAVVVRQLFASGNVAPRV